MRTVLVSPVCLDKPLYAERTRKWVRYHLREKPEDWDLVLFDNGSEERAAHDFLFEWQGRVQLVRMPRKYDRPIQSDYLYSWRAVYALGPLFIDLMEYQKVVHVENDFFIISQKMWDWIRALDEGWSTVWSTPASWPESAFQVLVGGCRAYEKFIAARDWRTWTGAQPPMEVALPFTLVRKDLEGDRYSERGIRGVPPNADYVAQMLPEDMP